MNPNPFLFFLKLTRPHFLIGTLGQAILGTGLAHYLGHTVDWSLFSLGLGWLMSLQLGIQYLIQYFDLEPPRNNNLPKPFTFYKGLLGEKEDQLPRNVALVATTGMFTITTFFTLGLAPINGLQPALIVMMGAVFMFSILFALPGTNLIASGQGELVFAILGGILVPGLSFLIQAETPHYLLIVATIPLAVILIPVLLAIEFPNYGADLKYQKNNLLQQLGWKSAMSVHNIFILIAFLLMGLTPIFGMPLRIPLSTFIAFPLGLLQIWQMRRIEEGAKPNWKALTWNAVVIFGLMTYVMTISFFLV